MIADTSRNRSLRRLLLAYLLLITAEFGEWLALIIYAYARGGASAAGLVVIVQLLPAMLFAPMIAAHLTRIGAARLLTLAYAVAATTLAGCATAILAHTGAVPVYLAAVGFSLAVSVARSMHPVLLPLVVQHPDELTGANVATNWCEGIGTLVGPLLVGVLATVEGPGLACSVAAALLVGTPLLTNVHLLCAATSDDEQHVGALAGLRMAVRVIASRPNTRALILFPVSSAVIEGAIDLLVVVLAVHVLTLKAGGAGYLSAAFGAGGLAGAAAALALVGRRLAVPLVAAALIGALALAALAVASTAVVIVLLLVLVGGTRAVQAVAAQTLLQRSTPLEVVMCAFSLIEAMRDAGLALGAVIVPLLINLGGRSLTFAGLACLAPLVVLVTARRIRRIDGQASIPVVEIGVLRRLDIFSALPPASIETLAREAHYERFAAGEAIMTEGDPGDAYLAITHGAVVILKGPHEIGRLGVGDGFGEIALLRALLRAVTRVATARAADETTVLSVAREPFLTALRAHAPTRATAERIAAGFLAPVG